MASPKTSSPAAVLAATVVLTIIAGGGGGALGLLISGTREPAGRADRAAPDVTPKFARTGSANGKHPSGGTERDGNGGEDAAARARCQTPGAAYVVRLPPILANLDQPSTRWVRLETSVVITANDKPFDAVARARVAQDVLARLRQYRLSELEGREGLLNLRSDLHDLIRIRAHQDVAEIIFTGMIIE